MPGFGYEVLITIMLPGSVVSTGVWLLTMACAPRSDVAGLLRYLQGSEWLASLALVLSAALFGTLLATLTDKFEEQVMDRWRAWRMGVPPADYEEQWLKYVDSLSQTSNPKNSLRVTWLFFKMRAGFAGLFLGAAYGAYSGCPAAMWLILAFSLLLIVFSGDDHKRLAEYRQRNFG